MSRRGQKTDETGVYRLTDGRFRVLAAAKDPEKGRMVQRQRTLPKGTTLEEAVEVRANLMDEIRTPATPGETRTLTDYCERWIERKARTSKPSSARTAAKALGDHILHVEVVENGEMVELGDIRLSDLRREHLLQWVDWASTARKPDEELYSSSTVRKWWRYFRAVVKDLAASGRIPRDYTQRISPPSTGRRGVRDKDVYCWYELQAIIDAAETAAPRRHAEIAVLCRTGMRSGELWALKWDDVNFPNGTIHVHRSVSGGRVTDKTKTDRDRVLPMLEPIGELLEEHRTQQLRRQHPGFERGLVFPSQKGTPRTPGSLRAAFENIREELELSETPTPQLIRQSVCTYLAGHPGVPEAAITALVGNTPEVRKDFYHKPNASTRATFGVLEGGEAI